MRCRTRIALAVLLGGLAAAPVLALGPVDAEIGAVYWMSEFDSTGGSSAVPSEDADAPGYRAELWIFNRYGVRAGVYNADLDDLSMDSSDSTSLDVLWKAFSPSDNNFLAVGAGWQEIDLATIGLGGDTSGPRLALEARMSLGLIYVYGQGAYLPSLDDTPATFVADGRFEDLTGQEYEVGVSWKIAPFLSMRGGYRSQTVEFTRTGFDPAGTRIDGEAEASGFLVGLTARF